MIKCYKSSSVRGSDFYIRIDFNKETVEYVYKTGEVQPYVTGNFKHAVGMFIETAVQKDKSWIEFQPPSKKKIIG